MYTDDEMLMLSGIQHFMFCPRQWALIHIEQQWADNRLTSEGQILHQNVDNPFYRQKNGNVITLRSVNIASKELGLYGIADAIELIPSENSENSITHNKYEGFWKPYPIEYKRGRQKPDEIDVVQLAAQVMCLEEMYGINIPSGAIYYNEERHRVVIQITIKSSEYMHKIFKTGVIPKPEPSKSCKNCSLKDICLPKINNCNQVSTYLKKNLYEDIT